MAYNINLLLAKKYLFSKKKEKFLSVTIKFAFIGIAIGVATLIIVTSVMNGFQYEIIDKLTGVNGHIVIKSENGINKARVDFLLNHLKKINDINKIIPVLQQNALLATGQKYDGILVNSFDYKNNLKIVKGSRVDGTVGIGRFMTKKYNLDIGDRITIISPKVLNSAFGAIPLSKTFVIGYIFESGIYHYDAQVVMLPFEYAKKLFDLEGVTDIQLFINNPMQVDIVMDRISGIIQNPEFIFDWKDHNENLFKAVHVEKNVMFLILTLIILVAGFSIITSMVMLVKDKLKDIAILKTIGFSSASIMKIFFYSGAMIGCIGTFIGGVLGVLFAYFIDDIKKMLEKCLQFDLFPAEIYYLLELPSKIEVQEVVIIISVTLLISFLSAIFPALKAAKMKPLDILRYE